MNDVAPAPMSFLMLGAAHEVEDSLERSLGQVGLSLAKFKVLSQLLEAGEPLALGALAERCSCVRSNMTQLIDRLEIEKLVARVSDPGDRRSVRAVLTEAGRERYGEGARVLGETEREVFARLGEVERIALTRLFELLRKEP